MLAINQEVQQDVPYECTGHIIVSASVFEGNMGLFGRVQPASRPGCPVFDALVVSVALTFSSFCFWLQGAESRRDFPARPLRDGSLLRERLLVLQSRLQRRSHCHPQVWEVRQRRKKGGDGGRTKPDFDPAAPSI